MANTEVTYETVMWALVRFAWAPPKLSRRHLREPGALLTLCGRPVPVESIHVSPADSDQACQRCAQRAGVKTYRTNFGRTKAART